MQISYIRLSTIQDIRRFVETVSMTDVEVDLSSDRYVVDGKSIMGIFSLDLSKELTLNIHSDDCSAFMDEIKSYIVK